jgi:hypothetical protein
MACALLERLRNPARHGANVKRIDIMQAHEEDFSKTNPAPAPSGIDKVRDDDAPTCAQAAELEQLAERVSAARSVY